MLYRSEAVELGNAVTFGQPADDGDRVAWDFVLPCKLVRPRSALYPVPRADGVQPVYGRTGAGTGSGTAEAGGGAAGLLPAAGGRDSLRRRDAQRRVDGGVLPAAGGGEGKRQRFRF